MQPLGATCSPLKFPHTLIHRIPSAENGLFSLLCSHAVTQMPTLIKTLSQVLLCSHSTLYLYIELCSSNLDKLLNLRLFSKQKKKVNSVTCWVFQKANSYMISVCIFRNVLRITTCKKEKNWQREKLSCHGVLTGCRLFWRWEDPPELLQVEVRGLGLPTIWREIVMVLC